MKIRNSFVSNSSSSSFVAFIDKAKKDEFLQKFSEKERALFEAAFSLKEIDLLGKETLTFDCYISDEGCWEIMDQEELLEQLYEGTDHENNEDWEQASTFLGKVEDIFRENKNISKMVWVER